MSPHAVPVWRVASTTTVGRGLRIKRGQLARARFRSDCPQLAIGTRHRSSHRSGPSAGRRGHWRRVGPSEHRDP